MPLRSVELPTIPAPVADGVEALQHKLELRTRFTSAVEQQATALVNHEVDRDGRLDATEIEFIAIDPPGSMDLDQILHIERDGDGYLVRYGIADVSAVIAPGSPIDQEAHLRGQTFYAPGARIPLHPIQVSEQAASLLDDSRARAAYVWSFHLDAEGAVVSTQLDKAMVINRAKLSYEKVQADIDAGTGHPSLALLKEVGELRLARERKRGGISLNLPDQEVVPTGNTWDLEYRTMLPVEDWNAQISLMTGIEAAKIMLEHQVGIVRTLPPAQERDIARLRRSAKALGVQWPQGQEYPEFVRSLNPAKPKQLAALFKCISLFRGASYLAFNGEIPDVNVEHAALATPYAHTTAPLRRLVDKYVLEICWCLLGDHVIPRWVTEQMATIPEIMDESGRKASGYERGIIDLAEALVMQHRVGERFQATLVDVAPSSRRGTYQIQDPAVEARIPDSDPAKLGQIVTVEVLGVNLETASMEFRLV